MAATRFFVDKKKINKDGATIVSVLDCFGRQSIKINKTVSVAPNGFDKKKGRVKGIGKKAIDQKLIVDWCLVRVNEIMVRYRLQFRVLTPGLLLRGGFPSGLFFFYSFCQFFSEFAEQSRHFTIFKNAGRASPFCVSYKIFFEKLLVRI